MYFLLKSYYLLVILQHFSQQHAIFFFWKTVSGMSSHSCETIHRMYQRSHPCSGVGLSARTVDPHFLYVLTALHFFLCFRSTGNIIICCLVRHSIKWDLNFFGINVTSVGSMLRQRAVTVAIACKPQSLRLSCCWTFIYWSVSEGFRVNTIPATHSFTFIGREAYKL